MATNISNVDAVRIQTLKTFADKFKEDATICACAPGRVNLIGEHTDYNEGFVFPMVINFNISNSRDIETSFNNYYFSGLANGNRNSWETK